jgi:hypothetical protein
MNPNPEKGLGFLGRSSIIFNKCSGGRKIWRGSIKERRLGQAESIFQIFTISRRKRRYSKE